MTEQRKEKIKVVREKLKALTPEQREEMAKRLGVVTIEGRSLSVKNQIMLAVQLSNPTVVGGFKQWQTAGRSVKKGEHGGMIFYPVGSKDKDGDITDASNFFTATVFDISQTEIKDDKPVPNLIYNLTGKTGDKCISNGNTWTESIVTPEPLASI